MKKITLGLIVLLSGMIQAQLIIDNVPSGPKIKSTPEYLTTKVLVIPNPMYSSEPQTVFPFNVVYNKKVSNATIYNDQAAKWETGLNAGNLGLGSYEYGVLLTTGQATVAFGPNNKSDASALTAIPVPPTFDDTDLKILANGNDVKNVSILEFDFLANGNDLNIEYLFASEEYTEYSNSAYNDAFGFFLSGPGISGKKGFVNDAVNLAILPTTTSGNYNVTINNVNQNVNPEYFVSNGEGLTSILNTYTQYDGFTKLLKATFNSLQVGQTYHMKLAIGNVKDNNYDSAVFVKNLSNKNTALTLKENILDTKFSVYPNPSSNSVVVSAASNIAIKEVKIIDSNGRIIKSVTFDETSAIQLNISDIQSGIYLLEVNSSEGKAVKRLIKN